MALTHIITIHQLGSNSVVLHDSRVGQYKWLLRYSSVTIIDIEKNFQHSNIA